MDVFAVKQIGKFFELAHEGLVTLLRRFTCRWLLGYL